MSVSLKTFSADHSPREAGFCRPKSLGWELVPMFSVFSRLDGTNHWSSGMIVRKQRDRFRDRNIEPLEIRRKRRAAEAPEAMKDYLRAQEAARERLAALREERLAREAKERSLQSNRLRRSPADAQGPLH